MSSLSPETRALIDAAADTDLPTSEERARLREALVARLGIGAAAVAASAVVANGASAGVAASGTASTLGGASAAGGSATMTTASAAGALGATKAAAAATGLSLTVKIAGAAVLASAGAFTAMSIAEPVRVTTPSAVAAQRGPAPIGESSASPTKPVGDLPVVPLPAESLTPDELPNATPAEPARADRSSAPSSRTARAAPIARPSTSAPSLATGAAPAAVESAPPSSAAGDGAKTPTTESTIATETALLRRAHAALVSGDATGALALLDEHGRTFPSGALAEERDAERVAALCASGQVDRARAEASRFIAAHPGSAVASRVRRTCESR